MANANRPSGLSPVRMITGAPYNGQATLYSIDKDYTTALYIGDPVISSGTANDKGVQGITLAAVTGPIRGVIVGLGTSQGLLANPSNLDITYRPGAATTADWYALVVDDPNVVFEVQEIGTGTPLTKAACGLNADLETGTGNGFVSGWMVGNDNEGVTATLQVRLLGLAQRADNAFGQYAKWEVLINAHELRVGQVGL
jgi:hypothetical protein